MQQALDAAARASKGFSLHLCTQARPRIGDLLAGPLQAAISIPQVCLQAKPGACSVLKSAFPWSTLSRMCCGLRSISQCGRDCVLLLGCVGFTIRSSKA